MELQTLKQSLENRIRALEEKKKAALDKGAIELFNIFDSQVTDSMLSLHILNKGERGGLTDREKETLKESVIESLPNLSLYIRKKSIHNAVKDSLEKALKKLEE
jgi:hypothetical protein